MATPFEIVYGTGAIRSINSSGVISTLSLTSVDSVYIAKGGIGQAWGFCVDGSGNVYVGDVTHNCIWKINPAGVVTRIAGTGVSGNTGNGGSALSAEVEEPTFLAVDAAGNVYFIDTNVYELRCVNTQSTTQTLLGISIGAGNIALVAGTGSYGNTGNGGEATSAKISADGAIAIDPSGNLWMACSDFHYVRQINTSGTISEVIGTGTAGHTGDGGAYGSAELNAPTGLAFDNAGNLYIVDELSYSVRAVNLQGTTQTLLNVSIGSGDINTVAGTPGTSGFSGDGAAATSAKLTSPFLCALDSSGNFYLTDTNRVRIVTTAGVINTVAGTGTAGSGPDGGLATNTAIGGTHGANMSVVAASPNVTPTPGSLSVTSPISISGVAVGESGTAFGQLTATTDDVVVSGVTLSGVNPSNFAISGISFPVTVVPGTPVSFTVTFSPTITLEASSIATFDSDASNSPSVASLTGTTPATIPDFPCNCVQPIQYYLNLFTSEYKGGASPNLMAFAALLAQPFMDVMQCLCTFISAFDISTAVGVQLDILGIILGVSRNLPFNPVGVDATTTEAISSTGSQTVTVNNTAYMSGVAQQITGSDSHTESVVPTAIVQGVSFTAVFTMTHVDGSTVTTTPPSATLGDTDYRVLLMAKVVQNQFNGQYQGANSTLWQDWQVIFPGGHIYITDNQNMTTSVLLVGAFTPIQQQMITNHLIVPEAETVEFTYEFATLPAFGFDDLNPTFIAGFDVGYWA